MTRWSERNRYPTFSGLAPRNRLGSLANVAPILMRSNAYGIGSRSKCHEMAAFHLLLFSTSDSRAGGLHFSASP
jgi:hypothetical protein